MSKSSKQTVTQNLDPRSQAFVNQMRGFASQGAQGLQGGGPLFVGPDNRPIMDQIQQFMNPFQSQVIDATRGEFDHLRGQASAAARQQATGAGAFGGSRAAVLEGTRMGELDRAQASTMAGLHSQNFQQALGTGLAHNEHQRQLQERMLQEPLFRNQMQLQMMNMGLGPTGMTATQKSHAGLGDYLGSAAGLGLTMAGMGFNPISAISGLFSRGPGAQPSIFGQNPGGGVAGMGQFGGLPGHGMGVFGSPWQWGG